MPPFAQYYLRVKNVLHAIQALAIFVAWIMTIAILTKGGRLDGRVWYCFALVNSFHECIPPKRQADAPAVLVLPTCSHLPDGFPCFPTDTPVFQCLPPRSYRHRLYHILACCLCLYDCLGRTGISRGKGLEEQ